MSSMAPAKEVQYLVRSARKCSTVTAHATRTSSNNVEDGGSRRCMKTYLRHNRVKDGNGNHGDLWGRLMRVALSQISVTLGVTKCFVAPSSVSVATHPAQGSWCMGRCSGAMLYWVFLCCAMFSAIVRSNFRSLPCCSHWLAAWHW